MVIKGRCHIIVGSSVFHLIIDKPDAAYEADEKNGGHVAYITLRHGFNIRMAQLTFYAPPAPRMHL